MQSEPHVGDWIAVCSLEDIVPNTGVCALINNLQIAIFHVLDSTSRIFAIDNYDPNADAAVLSRGLVGSLAERVVVASPLYKQHFDLQTGECIEAPEHSVNAYPARIHDGRVWVAA